MPQPSQKIAARAEVSHEELFLARYAELRGWAQRLASGDRARAEDLVQDAYVHFTAARPDLSRVENLDGYLYTMLRNLHTSQLRRAARLRDRALPVVEYESAVVAARAADPRDLVRVQDELRACCRYACARKGTSKAGSVLALRFFHGYYPREIAAVSLTTREGVEERLRTARAEARQFLKDPSGLRFMRGSRADDVRFEREGCAQTTEALLADLRRALFDAREGACPPAGQLAGLYARKPPAPLDTRLLAHVVSCEACLEEVNRLQGLAPLSERFPVDVAGAETRTKGSDGGGGDDEGGGGGDDDAGGARAGEPGGGDAARGPGESELLSLRVRARELFEHRPRELCVAVNGRVLAAQRTGAARCEQTLSVPEGEGVEFVEVLSEQEVRLLLLDVNEYQALAEGELTASVALSDERRLEARLTLDGAWPRVRVVYEEPRLAADAAPAREGVGTEGFLAGAPSRASAWLSGVAGWLRNSGFWLRPATVAAGLSVLVVAALLLTRVSVPTASAAELLARSAAAEDRLAADAGHALHRTYFVEETPTGGGVQTERLRVEVWQSAARGLKLRRAYDRAGRLVAGEWERADGTRTVYDTRARGGAASAEPAALVASGELWRLDPSPRVFAALVGDARRAEVEDALGSYVLTYRAEGAVAEGSLAAATLRLAKSDLRATGQTLTVMRGGAPREYRFVESAFERVPHERVEPRVFEPEAELLSKGASTATAAGQSAQGASSAAESVNAGAGARPVVASPELEVEVAYLLSRIRADLGEQVSLTRTTGGQLRVEALAETAGRKEEILRALGPVIGNPAVSVDVSTVEERLARERARAGAHAGSEVEVSAGAAPADEELRRYFAARVVGERAVEEEVRRLGARAMGHSRAALLHASALRTMAARFTPAEARALASDARAKWLAMLNEHARAVRREVRALNGELRPVFSPGSAGGNAGAAEADPRAAAERLYALTSSTDEAVRSAFNSTAGGAGPTPALRSRQFWRGLQAAEALAASIPAAYEK